MFACAQRGTVAAERSGCPIKEAGPINLEIEDPCAGLTYKDLCKHTTANKDFRKVRKWLVHVCGLSVMLRSLPEASHERRRRWKMGP